MKGSDGINNIEKVLRNKMRMEWRVNRVNRLKRERVNEMKQNWANTHFHIIISYEQTKCDLISNDRCTYALLKWWTEWNVRARRNFFGQVEMMLNDAKSMVALARLLDSFHFGQCEMKRNITFYYWWSHLAPRTHRSRNDDQCPMSILSNHHHQYHLLETYSNVSKWKW